MIDELISATIVKSEKSDENDYFKGIPVAKYDRVSDKVFLYNHLDLNLSINQAGDGTERIVEFDILPRSIDWSKSSPCDESSEHPQLEIIKGAQQDIAFTYSVVFSRSRMEWAHRYDHYMKTENGYIHYELLLIVTFLVGFVAWIAAY